MQRDGGAEAKGKCGKADKVEGGGGLMAHCHSRREQEVDDGVKMRERGGGRINERRKKGCSWRDVRELSQAQQRKKRVRTASQNQFFRNPTNLKT